MKCEAPYLDLAFLQRTYVDCWLKMLKGRFDRKRPIFSRTNGVYGVLI